MAKKKKKVPYLIALTIGAMLWPLLAFAEKAEYQEMLLQNAATATGQGQVLAVDRYTAVALDVTITNSATVSFEGSGLGTTATAVTCVATSNTSGTLVTSTTSSGLFQCNVAGLRAFQARISSYASGSVTVFARATTAMLGKKGGGGSGSLTVQEQDGTPLVSGVSTIQVTNGSLTDNGGGNITIATSGASNVTIGSSTVTGGTASSFLYVGAGPLLQQVSITGLVLGNGASVPTAYGGVTCTNQVLRVLSGTGAGTCVTITSAFVDSSVAVVGTSNTWTAGVKQTFSPNATNAGFNPGSFAGDPSGVVNGDVWYNSNTDKYRCKAAGVSYNCTDGAWVGTASSGILKATSQGNLTSATAGTDYAGVGVSNSWTAGIKQTFSPNASFAGFNPGSFSTTPATTVDGDIWYDTGLAKLRCKENGSVVNCIGSGGGAPAFSAITSATNTTATMIVGSGAALTTSGTGTITATGVAADSVALTTGTTGNYVSSATASQGLLMTGTEGASLGLIACTNGQILKNSGGTSWACSADSTGGSPTFDTVGSGTNTTAAMVMGAGGSLVPTSTGIITATSISPKVVTVNAGNTPYTSLASDYLLLCDTTAGARTINLPAATTKVVYQIKTLSSANSCTVNRAGADTIDGGTSAVLTVQYEAINLASDGTATWEIF